MKAKEKMCRAPFGMGMFLVVLVFLMIPGFTQGGILDETFGSNKDGLATTEMGAPWGNAIINSLAIQPDGKIVAGGLMQREFNYYQFALSRFKPDGTLDASFGSGGKVDSDFSGFSDLCTGIALQPDGKIVAGGHAQFDYDSTRYMILARYLSSGALDGGFGQGGVVYTDWSPGQNTKGYNYIEGIALQPDGKILGAGTSKVGSQSWRFIVVRYKSDGTLDTKFGQKGLAAVVIFNNPLDGESNQANAVTVQPDGKILAVGTAHAVGGQRKIVLVRLKANGTRDPSFGNRGVVITSLPFSASSRAVSLQSDGKILVGVNSDGPGGILRYNTNGILDKTFGQKGLAAADSSVFSLAIQGDGKILAGGACDDSGNSDFCLYRYNRNGTPDRNFGNDGRVKTDFFGGNDYLMSIALQPNGRVVAGGSAFDGTINLWALARYDDPGVPQWGFSRNQRAIIAQYGKPHQFFTVFDETGVNRYEVWTYGGDVGMAYGFTNGEKAYETALTTAVSESSLHVDPGQITIKTTPAHLVKFLGQPDQILEDIVSGHKYRSYTYISKGLTAMFDINQMLGAITAPPLYIDPAARMMSEDTRESNEISPAPFSIRGALQGSLMDNNPLNVTRETLLGYIGMVTHIYAIYEILYAPSLAKVYQALLGEDSWAEEARKAIKKGQKAVRNGQLVIEGVKALDDASNCKDSQAVRDLAEIVKSSVTNYDPNKAAEKALTLVVITNGTNKPCDLGDGNSVTNPVKVNLVLDGADQGTLPPGASKTANLRSKDDSGVSINHTLVCNFGDVAPSQSFTVPETKWLVCA